MPLYCAAMGIEDYSKDALLSFIRQCVMTGVVNPATGRSRQNAARHLLPLTTEAEAADVRQLDVEELAGRFHKLEGASIRPESLRVYQRRLQAAIDDFMAWRCDPDAFSPSATPERTLFRRPDAESFVERSGEEQAREDLALDPPRKPGEVFPIPIREGVVVYVQNVPLDLTGGEAARICRVVRALVDDPDPAEDEQ